LTLLSCSNKAQNCAPDLSECNAIWKKIYSGQSNFLEKICDFNYYEQKSILFNKKEFIKFLTLESKENNSLITLLNTLDFELKIDSNNIIGYTNLEMLNCASGKKSCSRNELFDEIILFQEPIRNCQKNLRNREIEIFAFSNNEFFQQENEFFAKLKFEILKLKFIGTLFKQDDLFKANEVINNERIRKTTFNVKKSSRSTWSSSVSYSEHKNKEAISYGQDLILNFLNESINAKESAVDSLVIDVRFYEKDQSKIN